MMADELLSAQDLITAKKHDTFHSEVVTGKVGGLSTGANIDYATNAVTGQVQKTLPKILDDLDWSYVGLFADGVTFTDKTDFAVDAVGTQWIYTGNYPFTATAGTVPSEPTYQVVHVKSASAISNANGGSVQDFIDQTESNINLVQNDIVITNTNVSSNTSRISDLEADDPLGKLSLHNNDPLAHPQLSAFITAEADRAEAAAEAATVNADVYPTIAAGLLATIDGQQFQVIDGYELVRYRRDTATTYTEMLRTLTTEGIAREMERSDDVVNAMASKIDLPYPPSFGWINGRAYGTSSTSAGAVVMSVPATTNTVINKIVILAGATLGDIEIATYTKSGDTFTRTSTFVTVTTKDPLSQNVFDSLDFTPFVVNSGEYVGFSMPNNGMMLYEPTPPIDLGYFYGDYANKNSFTDTSSDNTVNFQIALYDTTVRSEITYINNMTRQSRKFAGHLYDTTVDRDGRIGATSNLIGSSTPLRGTFLAGKTADVSGRVKTVNVSIIGSGSITVVVYNQTGALEVAPQQHVVVPVVNGINSIPVDLDILKGQYIGLIIPSPLLITTEVTTVGHDGYIASVSEIFEQTTTVSTMAPDYNRRFDMGFDIEFTDELSKPWLGETLITFGDSITWYDGNSFDSTHIQSGQIAVGYQHYLKDKLGCSIDNQGASGLTLPEIYSTKINVTDFTSAFAVSITSGANDHRKAVTVGTVLPAASTFNASTFTGALQLSIERIIDANKDTKIFLITPIRGYFFESGTVEVPGPYNGEMEISREYVDAIKDVGKIYGIPVIDWYDSTSLNILNYLHWLGDNPAVFTAYSLHPKNAFFEIMGKIAAEQINIYK